MMLEANGGVAEAKTVTFDAAEYAQYLEFVAHTKERNVAEKLKAIGSIKVGNRRQTLVMRRMKEQITTIAPDEDIAAYGEIYKLKNPNSDAKSKTYISDNEIKAYKVLDPDFKAAPTLEAITAKVEEMVATGELTTDGNAVEEDDQAAE